MRTKTYVRQVTDDPLARCSASTLTVQDTFRDTNYARLLYEKRIEKFKQEFDWKLFGRPVVSRRSDGRYAVVDGNHRIAAAVALFGATVEIPVDILPTVSYREEARLYVHLNKDRWAHTIYQLFKGNKEAGDPETVAIAHMLDARAITPLDKTDGYPTIGLSTHAIRQLYRVYRTGSLPETLDILIDAWGRHPDCLGMQPLAAVGQFLVDYPKADPARLRKVLGAADVGLLSVQMRTASQTLMHGKEFGTVGSRILVGWYNRGVPTRKQLAPKTL